MQVTTSVGPVLQRDNHAPGMIGLVMQTVQRYKLWNVRQHTCASCTSLTASKHGVRSGVGSAEPKAPSKPAYPCLCTLDGAIGTLTFTLDTAGGTTAALLAVLAAHAASGTVERGSKPTVVLCGCHTTVLGLSLFSGLGCAVEVIAELARDAVLKDWIRSECVSAFANGGKANASSALPTVSASVLG